MDELFRVWIEPKNGYVVVHAAGEVDISTAPDLQRQLTDLSDDQAVVIDLTDVTFLDSSGLSVLIAAHKRQETKAAGKLRLVITQPQVLKVLEVTGLMNIFSLHRTVDEATAE